MSLIFYLQPTENVVLAIRALHLSVFGGHIGEQRIHILGGVRVHIFAESGLPYASCCFLFKQVLVIVFSYHGLLCFFIERMLSVLLL